MRYTDRLPLGAGVVVRSSSGVSVIGRLNGGEDGVVTLTDWRWIKPDEAIYDLVASARSDVIMIMDVTMIMTVDEETYGRLAGLTCD